MDSAHGSLKALSTSTQNTPSTSSSRVSPSAIPPKRFSARKLNQLEKECSQDSAVSVFSENDHAHQKSPTKSSGSEDCFTNSTTVEKIDEEVESPIFSTGGGSMEYDDMFEMYSDTDGGFRVLNYILESMKIVIHRPFVKSYLFLQQRNSQISVPYEIGLIEDNLHDRSPPPNPKMVRIPVRKMSFSAFGPCSLTINQEKNADAESPAVVKDGKTRTSTTTSTTAGGSSGSGNETTVENGVQTIPKLRRKDLNFDDPVILAVKENGKNLDDF